MPEALPRPCPHCASPTTAGQLRTTALGRKVMHRRNRYLNNGFEQDHTGIKQRYYPMRGFGSFEAAARFCTAPDELSEYFRPQWTLREAVSLAERRRLLRDRWAALMRLIATQSPI